MQITAENCCCGGDKILFIPLGIAYRFLQMKPKESDSLPSTMQMQIVLYLSKARPDAGPIFIADSFSTMMKASVFLFFG